MTLIKSISGIRGTIGGQAGDSLNPLETVRIVTAYAAFILKVNPLASKIIVGRDARTSGEMVRNIVSGTLMGMGLDVVDIGLASTPTTELAVIMSKADGGIIITASHNPGQWNALKLLNNKGEFLSQEDGSEVMRLAEGLENGEISYADSDSLGRYFQDYSFDDKHIDAVTGLKIVDTDSIKRAGFRVCVDSINSVGGIIIPKLLRRLGVDFRMLNGEPDGKFAHNPEPLEKNLGDIMREVAKGGYDLGIVVDPDVDRLAFISEDGSMFGEEYTLVSVADYVLGITPGNTVSNLSSTRALRDITLRYGGRYEASAVGEVNVSQKIKEIGAVIGGEGNGGVIYPECHTGRDALVGIALFLSSLAQKGCKASELRAGLPQYFMAKNRIDLSPETDIDSILERIRERYKSENITDIDGIKIDFDDRWVHLRKSNTEPIIRVYSEAPTQEEAEKLAQDVMSIAYEPANKRD